jgi:hypothetical protein
VRKLISLSLGVALATTVFVAVPAAADSAVVVRDQGMCGMPGADADGNITFGGIGEVTHIVENQNRVIMTCKGDGLVNDSGRGQHFSGYTCGTLRPDGSFVFTDDSHATVSKSGKGSVTCRFSFA